MNHQSSHILDFMSRMGKTIGETTTGLDKQQVTAFLDKLLAAKRIYVTGAGRSGLIARAFAMRLMHLGLDVFVLGETITPAFGPGDVLVIVSGSGETHSMITYCQTAKELGGETCLLTASPDSAISRIASTVVNLGDPYGYYRKDTGSFERRQVTGEYRSTSAFAPLGTLFETMALVFTDAVVSAMIEEKHRPADFLRDRVANME